VEVDEERGHRVEQPIAIRPRSEGETAEEAAVLDRIGQVFGGEDRAIAVGGVREPDRGDRRQPGHLEPAQDIEFGRRDTTRLLLERVRPAIADQEADEVSRRADRQVAEFERVGRPVGQWQVPRQVEQVGAAVAQAKARESRGPTVAGQSFLRR
jgi:hypothetical protein